MANTLCILNDAPYGSERTYNGLRLAGALAKRADQQVRIFLMGDAASCAKANQKVPHGYYSVELMLRASARHGVEIRVCGTCMDARGISEAELTPDAQRGTLEHLADWSVWTDQTLVF
jgi:uncharacterized protein involved in oxidation of intracellular sulfur